MLKRRLNSAEVLHGETSESRKRYLTVMNEARGQNELVEVSATKEK